MSLAIQTTDNFGTWDVIGIRFPIYEVFIDYPDYTESLSSLLRLTFGGVIQGARSYGLIRSCYEVGSQSLYGKWLRVYPKEQQELIEYVHPPELRGTKTNPRCFWQIQKRHKQRRFIGVHPDTEWNLKIEVCNETIVEFPPESETQAEILGFI